MSGNLEKQSDMAMMTIYRRAKVEARYAASIFFNMINEKGALATAKRLVNSKEPSNGYTQLFLKGRLDLTVEAVVVENLKWHTLFVPEDLDKARGRWRAFRFRGVATSSAWITVNSRGGISLRLSDWWQDADLAISDLQERMVRITIVAAHVNEMSLFDDNLAHLVGDGVIAVARPAVDAGP
jgi:hypothetical protein